MGLTQVEGGDGLKKPVDFADNEKARFGTGGDLQIYHNGSHNVINGAAGQNLEIQTNAFRVKNQANTEAMIVGQANGAVQLFHDNNEKLITKSDGVDITGELQCDSLDVDGSGDISGNLNLHGNLDLQDNDKILLCDGDDFEIYHSGTHNRIDSNFNDLILRNTVDNRHIYLQTDDGSGGTTTYLQCSGSNGEVTLHHYGTTKLNTKSDGVNIHGELECDTLDVDGNADIAGTVRINQLIVDDDGSGDPTMSVRGDDSSPWGFVVGNDTYSSNAAHGYKIYQDNSGNIHQQWRGDGEFTNFYLNAANGSLSQQVFHVDTNRQVFLKWQGNERLKTSSSGVDITGTLSGNGSGLTNTCGLKSIQVFASVGTATWTKPSGINTIKVYVTAGGGGGGGTDNDDMAGGGGAGGTAIEIIDVSSVSSVTVTVGGGGTGASNSQNSNNYGGTSSFGSYCSATGGNRYGGNWAVAGAGGSATGGSYNIDGGDGQGGLIDNTGSHQAAGTGGASFWGGGGRGATRSSSSNHQNGRAWGSGGGGGANGSTSRNGKQGIVVVEEYA
jgi:hypothetical protein